MPENRSERERDGHPSDDELVEYVGETLDAAACAAVEAHVGACASCATRLARTAEAELVLHALGAEARGSVDRVAVDHVGVDQVSVDGVDRVGVDRVDRVDRVDADGDRDGDRDGDGDGARREACHVSDDELATYLDDGLDETARRAFEAHLARCKPCGVRLARAAEAELALHALGAESPSSIAPRVDIRRGDASALEDRLASERARRRPRVVVAAAAGALAAAFAVAIAVRDRTHDVPRDRATATSGRATAPLYNMGGGRGGSGGAPPARAADAVEASEIALATPEERLDLPSSAELVTFVPEAER